MELKLSDLDVFGKKLGLFYKNKDKISSFFGLAITFVYIFISTSIFLYYTIQTIKHKDLTVNDSIINSEEVPSINLNNSESLYFAFAIEEPMTASKFVDESIYTAEAIFVDCVKDDNGTFKVNKKQELKVERCDKKKFGKHYQHLFKKEELNNAYCIDTLDFDLKGGFIYKNLSLIKIDIFPCKNSTENNFHCQPQKKIDYYLANGYFTILLKDVGLNPSNYSFPLLPTLQDIYTSISKQIYRDLMLYYEITEVRTDSGIFLKQINTERFLKFDKKIETFYLRPEENYYNGESIIQIQIRLSDNIHVQNRDYKKMQNVFATAGGYMQMLNALFSLLSTLVNNFNYDNIIISDLFDFDIIKNKIIIKNKKFKKFEKKTYMSDLNNSLSIKEKEKTRFNITLKSSNKDINCHNENKYDKKSKKNSKNYRKSMDKTINASAYEKMSNISKIDILPFSINPNFQINNKLIKTKKKKLENLFDKNEKNLYINFKLNLLEYFCLGKCRHQKKHYNQFKKGTLIFKQKLDIINIFNYISLCETMSGEKINTINLY